MITEYDAKDSGVFYQEPLIDLDDEPVYPSEEVWDEPEGVDYEQEYFEELYRYNILLGREAWWEQEGVRCATFGCCPIRNPYAVVIVLPWTVRLNSRSA